MANTSVIVEMDLTANPEMSKLGNSENTSTNNSTFANINYLGTDFTKNNYNDFMTLEHNINILDGSLSHFKNDINTGYFSTNLSNDDCTVNNIINIDFSKCKDAPFKLPGINFNFGNNNYMEQLTITYIENNNTIVNTFYPAKQNYKAIMEGYNVNKIKIELEKTRFPRMFSRLHHIDYGFLYIWKDTDVINCNIIEEISPISNVLPINIADVTLYSEENEFNILNQKGIYNFLDKGHKLKIKGIYDNKIIDMGTFYLDTWEGTKPYEVSFHLISLIGILEQYQSYLSGLITYKLENLLTTIFYNVKQNFEFKISDELKNIELKNIFLQSGNVRSVLQNILFTLNACADDTRDGILKISRVSQTITSIIPPNKVIDTVNISKTEQVTGIDINVYDYIQPDSTYLSNLQWENLFDGQLTKDVNKKFFLNSPAYVARYKTKSAESYPNSFIFIFGLTEFTITPSTTDNYIVQVCYFIENKSLYQKKFEKLNPNIPDNIVKIENNKLINSNNYQVFSNRLMEYYGMNQLKIEGEYLFDGSIKTSTASSIYTDYQNYCQGFIVKQSIDLSGGFISKVTMLGIHNHLSDYNFMNNGNDNLGNTGQYNLIADNNIQL